MNEDIVKRLRGDDHLWSSVDSRVICEEAADEIERLRGVVAALEAEWKEEHGWGVPGSDLDSEGNLIG